MTASAFNLRSREFASMVFTASVDRTAGDLIQVEDRVGVVVNDTDSGEEGVIVYEAEVIDVPKATGTGITFTAGDKVYYDSGNDNVTNVAGGNSTIGTTNEDAGASATTVEIDLKGQIFS